MPVQVAGAPTEGTVRMTSGEEKLFVGVAQIAEDGRVAPKRLLAGAWRRDRGRVPRLHQSQHHLC